MSAEAEIFAVRMTFGADNKTSGREPTDYVNSKFILMWGWSPADGTFGTGTPQYLKEAKKKGVRIVCVDPRRTRTSRQFADEHIFIKPSTDAAALIAMAYVIVSEGLHDQAYCDRHVLGFDDAHLPEGAPAGSSYRSYLMGESDGVPKTPEWAAPLCGIPAETIRRLAIEFGSTKPAALQCGYAPGRTAFGEQFHRAAYALAAITGNIGIVGGNSGVSNGVTGRSGIKSLPPGANPIDSKVATPLLADLLARGTAGGYPADIKLIYSAGGDLFNQCPNAGKMAASLDGVEFIVVQDHFLTPTARHADIVLPATTFWERNDVHTPWGGAGHYAIYMKQAIQPMYECRNDIDIFADLAARVGINDYNELSEEQWLRELTADAVGDFDAFTEQGVARFAPPEDAVAFARQIRDPENHKFSTPSGKIEVYSTTLAAKPDPYGLGVISAIPTWIPPVEEDPRYPLMLCSAKSRARTHSIHGNQPLLARIDPDDVPMHRRRRGGARHRRRRQGARVQRPGCDVPAGEGDARHRARRRLDQGGRVVRARRGWHGHQRLRQCPGRGSCRAVRRHDLQHESGRDRAGQELVSCWERGSPDPLGREAGLETRAPSKSMISAPVERRALLDRIEQRPVALLDDMADGEGRARLLAERAHHPVVAVVAKQDDARQRGERGAAFGAQVVGDNQPAFGRKIGERAARQDREALEGEADVIPVATEALRDIGEDRLVVGARHAVALAGGNHRAGEGAQVGRFGGGQRHIDRH